LKPIISTAGDIAAARRNQSTKKSFKYMLAMCRNSSFGGQEVNVHKLSYTCRL